MCLQYSFIVQVTVKPSSKFSQYRSTVWKSSRKSIRKFWIHSRVSRSCCTSVLPLLVQQWCVYWAREEVYKSPVLIVPCHSTQPKHFVRYVRGYWETCGSKIRYMPETREGGEFMSLLSFRCCRKSISGQKSCYCSAESSSNIPLCYWIISFRRMELCGRLSRRSRGQ